jgi:DNA-directed RNA polymerase specialized sigma24 family protein
VRLLRQLVHLLMSENDEQDYVPYDETWLAGKARWIYNTWRPDGFDLDDIIQVGRIEAWKAELCWDSSRGVPLQAWQKTKARWGMMDLVRSDTNWLSYDPEEHGEAPVEPDWEGTALVACHRREINRAIGTLTTYQQEYIDLRFWQGWTYKELTEHFGYEPQGVWAGARNKLAKRLARLQYAPDGEVRPDGTEVEHRVYAGPEIEALLASGVGPSETARRTGASLTTVKRYARKLRENGVTSCP